MRTPGEQKLRDAVYGLYERRLRRSCRRTDPDRHISVIIDGDRRWARRSATGVAPAPGGQDRRVPRLVDDVGVKVVTVWILSTDDLGPSTDELEPLLRWSTVRSS